MPENSLDSLINDLEQRKPFPALAPKRVWNEALDHEIERLNPEVLVSHNLKLLPYAKAVKSGLHLINESLNNSHEISQDIANDTGSYWHGIMHRMEQDYSNAKYWFRQVGSHPVFQELQSQSRVLLIDALDKGTADGSPVWKSLKMMRQTDKWDPYLFIDTIESFCFSDNVAGPAETLLESIQWLELNVLFQYTYKEYCGGKRFASYRND